MTGTIFDIKKFAVNDGPGIRTAVFLKGCPLHCLWCHNPESQAKGAELSFIPEKCIQCGWCGSVCACGLNRNSCINCGKCTEQCYAGARKLIGRETSVDEVISEVMKDKIYYDNSGGGVTVSGGEPLFQAEFTSELLRKSRAMGLHTCLDTSGFAHESALDMVIPHTDIFLYDLKETNPEKHLLYTGGPLKIIIDNLKHIDAAGVQTILRCPLIPGLNVRDDHAEKIAKTASMLENLLEINLMPYHPLGESKSRHLGKEPLFTGEFADKRALGHFRSYIQERTNVPVKFA